MDSRPRGKKISRATEASLAMPLDESRRHGGATG
jgi:hypothetical protein